MKKLILIISVLFSSNIFAADITLYESGKGCSFSGAFIEGDIETGDFKKFQNIVSTLKNKYGKVVAMMETHIYELTVKAEMLKRRY